MYQTDDWPSLPPLSALVNKVHCLDALELLALLPDASVDAVITDPPYGLAGRVFDFPHKHYSAINEEWDHEAPIDWMSKVTRVLKPGGSIICFGVRQSIYKFASEGLRLGWRIVNDITWYKPDAAPNFSGRMMTESTERALWFCPDGTRWTYNLAYAKTCNLGVNLRDVWTFPMTRGERLHPAQKPIELMERIVHLFTNKGDIVVDPFGGSGTTARAAINTGRRYITGDLSAEYCDLMRRRLAQPYTPNMFDTLPTAASE